MKYGLRLAPYLSQGLKWHANKSTTPFDLSSKTSSCEGFGQRALILDLHPQYAYHALIQDYRSFNMQSLASMLSSWIEVHSVCAFFFFFVLGCSPPGLSPLILRHALSSRAYPFGLRIVLLSWDDTRSVYVLRSHPGFAHSICIPKNQCTLILGHYPFSLRFVLSSWNETRSVCALRSYYGFDHLVCTLDYRTLILRWYLFSLRFALSTWVRSFNMRILSLRSLLSFLWPSTTLSIAVRLHSLQTEVRPLCTRNFFGLAWPLA